MNERGAPEKLWSTPSWLVARVALRGAKVVDAAGVKRKEFSVLVALAESGPASQADLGRRLALDRSDLHAIVAGLERDGLVDRERDPADARRNRVKLTARGRAQLRRLEAKVDAAQDTLLAPLSKAERVLLTGLLARVVDHHAEREAAE
jgi:MarR family transcriptional regulator, lower aerobic nicotinate degradation pathway regulator